MGGVACIFEGAMTCCRKQHPNGVKCDREGLVSTLLGLYFDLYTQQKGGKKEQHILMVAELFMKQKNRIFPKTYQYTQEGGGTEERELFGDLITRVEYMVDADVEAAQLRMEDAKLQNCKFL